MCLPLIGAAISAVGTIASAQAQAAGYKAQAEYNERQARLSQQQGAYEAAQLARQHDRALGGMRSQYLSSGIALDGSVIDVLEDSATQASLDEQAIKFSAQIQSDNHRFQASMARMNAKNAMTGGVLGALATAVNGIDQWRAQNQQRTMIANPYVRY